MFLRVAGCSWTVRWRTWVWCALHTICLLVEVVVVVIGRITALLFVLLTLPVCVIRIAEICTGTSTAVKFLELTIFSPPSPAPLLCCRQTGTHEPQEAIPEVPAGNPPVVRRARDRAKHPAGDGAGRREAPRQPALLQA